MGPTPFVSLRHYRATLARIVELAGWRHASEFYGEVDEQMEQQLAQSMQQAQQGQQGGGEEVQALMQIEQMKAQAKQQETQVNAQIKQQELALREQEIRLKDDREREESAADFVLQAREEAHAHLKALDAVVRKLRVTMERGELATLED
jgi:vacuolar-type H+-ATPase subunit I/STV1